jgi:hypothetical protein
MPDRVRYDIFFVSTGAALKEEDYSPSPLPSPTMGRGGHWRKKNIHPHLNPLPSRERKTKEGVILQEET